MNTEDAITRTYLAKQTAELMLAGFRAKLEEYINKQKGDQMIAVELYINLQECYALHQVKTPGGRYAVAPREHASLPLDEQGRRALKLGYEVAVCTPGCQFYCY